MADEAAALLRKWANGEVDPLTTNADGRDGFDELADEIARDVEPWWRAFKTLFDEYGKSESSRLQLPFEVLLNVGRERLRQQIAEVAHGNPKIASAFWYAMDDLGLTAEAYRLLGRKLTLEAFVRHEPRIPARPSEPWPADEPWEDGWSSSAIFYLTEKDPDEAWALALELIGFSADPEWLSVVGAFIIEDLLKDHGDAMIDRIETEAGHSQRLQMALPTTRWAVPDHLVARVEAAAGPYWHKKS
jgi:uncharacterized protein DUF6869